MQRPGNPNLTPSPSPSPTFLEPLELRQLLAAGDLDPTFGVGGKLTHGLIASHSDTARDIAVLTDGRYLVAGETRGGVADFALEAGFAVARYNPDGTLDTTFGNAGRVTIPFDQSTQSFSSAGNVAMDIARDGKIVLAGGFGGFALARLNADGSADNTFGGGDGKVLFTFGNPQSDAALDLDVRRDGRIVVAGKGGQHHRPALAQLTSTGQLDTNFSGDGKLIFTPTSAVGSAQFQAVALDRVGNILVAGSVGTFFIARYTPAGELDPSFDTDGFRVEVPGAGAAATAIVPLRSGGVIVGGYGSLSGASKFLAARYDAAGQPDTSFGPGGIRLLDITTAPSRAHDLILQPDGKIVLAGEQNSRNLNDPKGDFLAVRLSWKGRIEQSFGNPGLNGRALISFSGDALESAYGIGLQSDGKVLLAGGDPDRQHRDSDFQITRLTPTGQIDTTFGGAGRAYTGFSGPASAGPAFADFGSVRPASVGTVAAARQADGRTLVLSALSVGIGGSLFAVTRLSADGSIDTTYGDGGTARIDVNHLGAESTPADIAIQSDGKAVAVGYARNTRTGVFKGVAVRLNTDGSSDASFGPGGIRELGMEKAHTVVRYGDDILIGGGGRFQGFVLIRLNADGQGDTGFGSGGVINTPFRTYSPTVFGPRHVEAYELLVQPDNKIVAVGVDSEILPTNPDTAFITDYALARYNPNGTLDTAFSGDGKFTLFPSLLGTVGAAALQSDGKILFAEADDIYRINANGTLDTTFGGGDGIADFQFGSDRDDFVHELLVDADDNILAAGESEFDDAVQTGEFALARLLADGSPDPAFTGAGAGLLTDFTDNDGARALLLLPDDKLLAIGYSGPQLAITRHTAA